MSLDERRARWQHLDLKHRDDDPADLDAGSELAEESMHLEALARMRVEQPWRFTPQDPTDVTDRRLFGWREDERFEQAGWPPDNGNAA